MKTMLHVLRKSNEDILKVLHILPKSNEDILKVLHILPKSNEDILKVIELSTFRQSSCLLLTAHCLVLFLKAKCSLFSPLYQV